ncbi:hypothetical protein U27_01362 [Candidatus Vecturithrix granuli]|uniref:N-acetyltransferase domain-containing protein n=1 Tax=Vecturithrix granuli TaxID=1499967 RepID=A0A081CA57_VECG1|nr:hypothetical protein U27_01362 [Candidatus Vecturithrix granuli]
MSLKIIFCPEGLNYEDFSQVDNECFPDEPVDNKEFLGLIHKGCFAAFDDNLFIGYCSINQKPDVLWIRRIGVAKNYRQKGVVVEW